MALRRHHYERAFEEYLRARRTPYVAVDEARKTLLPTGGVAADSGPESLKSFDFVVYPGAAAQPGCHPVNLLADVKGRRLPASSRTASGQTWVTQEDVDSLVRWQRLFGDGFKGAFVFVYWCDGPGAAGAGAQPADGVFPEVFEFAGRWYALRTVLLDDYIRAMKPRSPRWRTVNVPARQFERLARPLGGAPESRRPGPLEWREPGRVQSPDWCPEALGSGAGEAGWMS